MFNTTTVDFNEAEKACGDQSGYLVKIDDDSEQKFIHEQIKSTSGGLVSLTIKLCNDEYMNEIMYVNFGNAEMK